MTRHIRGRPKPPNWYINWPLYVCDSRYNDRDRVFVRIKNWASCIPDELRKGSGEGFYPIQIFDRTVMPRKVESPFVAGAGAAGGAKAVPVGPGGLVDEDEGRRRSGRAAAAKIAGTAGAETGTPEAHVEAASVPVAGPSTASAAPTSKTPAADRSLTVAAGGRSALGADPVIEMLPEETGKSIRSDILTCSSRRLILLS